MKISAAILVTLIAAALDIAYAQNNLHSFQHLTVKDGLSQSSVVSIARDSTGFMWFATQDGLNRYDGKNFIYYEKYFDDITNARNNRLGKIYVDNRNDVWIIPNTHIPEKYNRFKKTFTPLHGIKNISCMLQDSKNNYWFGSLDNEMIKISSDNKRINFTVEYSAKSINSIHQCFEDSRGTIWLASKNGLYFYDRVKNNFSPVMLPEGVSNIYCITEDKSQTLWAGSLGKGLLFKTKSDSIFKPFKFIDKNLSAALQAGGLIIESISVDNENNIWIGTYGSGLLIIKSSDNSVSQYMPDKSNPYSFNYKDVLCILNSRDDLTWLGTDGGGINLYDKNYTKFKAFTSGTVPQGIAVDIVRCIYKDDAGNTWIGTSGKGLTRYNPSLPVKWKTWLYEKDIAKTANGGNRVICLYVDKDGLVWLGTQGNGLMWFNSKTEQFGFFGNKGVSFPDKTTWCLYPAADGNVWAGTEDSGLCLLNKQEGLMRKVSFASDNKNNTPVKNIRCIVKINDTILCLGTDESGMFKYNTRQNKISAFALPSNITGRLQKIKSLYYDSTSQVLFIGTNGNGMAACNLKSMNINLFTVQDGLPNNVVYGIVPGNNNLLWLSTNKGLCSFLLPASSLHRPDIHLYDEKDGLQNTEFNTGAYFKDTKGTIYFGGIDGFNYFSPASITNSPATGNIVFTNCFIGGKQYTGDSAIETRHLLTLNPGENEFSISFALLNYSTPRQLNYQYQLKGYDKRWINAGSDNTANYTNLTPGLYYLYVTATNNDGSSITKPAMLSILVKPAFYQTLWFRIIAIASFALLIYWFVYWRIKSVRKQEQLKQMRTIAEMKALRAQMNPHFIFNCLNAIDNLIQTNQKDKATTYLARFAKLIRNVLDSSKSNMVPFNKDYDTLLLYLSLEQFRLNDKFEFSLSADDELLHADYKVPPLIIQPFVENAIHHGLMNKASADKKLEIKMQLDNDFIKYTITDNGIGRKAAAELKSINKPEHFSYGIEISRERAALHNNHNNSKPALVITDLMEKGLAYGTRVEIWIAV